MASLLIKRAAIDPKERIPVVLNLSSWQKSQSLVEWIADKMSSAYQVPSKLARNWLDQGYIVPLLDGLDEVKAENQPDCVEAINRYIDEFHPPGLVVCSRLKDYLWLPERLKMNGAICIEPLNQRQIDNYFATLGNELESLRTAIQEDTALQELAQSPLMLNIMSMAYQSADPESLAEKELPVEARRTKIFDAYVEKMFQRKESTNQIFPKEKVIGWLTWLARNMVKQSQSVFMVENLQPNWLDNSIQRFAYRGILSPIFGLLPWLLLGLLLTFMVRGEISLSSIFFVLSIGLFVTLLILISINSNSFRQNMFNIFSTLMIALVFLTILGMSELVAIVFFSGLYGLLLFGVGISSFNTIKLIERVSNLWKILFSAIGKYSLIFGIVGVLVFTILSHVGLYEAIVGLIVGMNLGLVFGLFIGLIHIININIKTKEEKTYPNQGIILSLKNGLSVSFNIFCATFIICTSIFALPGLLGGGVIIIGPNVVFGLYFGILGGLRFGLSSVIKHYALRLILYLNGKIPIEFIPFLDYCAKMILLKKVGGGYIFVHRMLLEYFAKLESTDSKSTKV